jgi:hypothetical protein
MLDDLLKIGGFAFGVIGAVGVVYGIYQGVIARHESAKRQACEDKVRGYQIDPVIVVQGGGGSFHMLS